MSDGDDVMARNPIPTYCFVLVVVRKGQSFLMVHERGHGQTWYLPAGRVELGETLVEAAKRETLEEAGVPIVVEGVLRIEHSVFQDGARMRVIFVARPRDDTPPLSEPNEDSLEAAWLTLPEIAKRPVRGLEVLEIFTYVLNGAPIYPINLITEEGTPYLR